jgi:hypothetical protein
MRAIALLTTLLLLAFQAQAETLAENTEEASDQEQPGDERTRKWPSSLQGLKVLLFTI